MGMMNMGSMFPGFGIFFGIFLISIVLIGLFFGMKSFRRWTRNNGAGLRGGDLNTRDSGNHAIQKKILQLAQDNGGVLTVSDVVLATSLSIKQAEATLNEMVDGFRIKMDVRDSGIVRYEFSEIVSKKD